MDGTYDYLKDQPKTLMLDDVKFYNSFEHNEYNFRKWKIVKLISNYEPCYEIIICKKTTLLFTNILMKYWRPILLDEAIDESLQVQYQHTIDNWINAESFAKMITRKLNGSQLLLLSDNNERISDECYLGEANIQQMIEILANNFTTTQLKWIKEMELENRLRLGWLNMKLGDNQKWILNTNQNLVKNRQ